MDIRNIEYFLHLAKYEHVSATADLLHISQPSLSKHSCLTGSATALC